VTDSSIRRYGSEHSDFIDFRVFIDRRNDFRMFKDPVSRGHFLTGMSKLWGGGGKKPHPLLWACSRHVRVTVTVSGIPGRI
jgi:hypothetical protein